VYRDTPDADPGDEYVVRSFDLRIGHKTLQRPLAIRARAAAGDYPESPELGIEQLTQLTWRRRIPRSRRFAFWVGDAPHHEQRGAAMKQAVLHALGAGIHLYPVSAKRNERLARAHDALRR